jgi:lysophospholipase L1-like esterase
MALREWIIGGLLAAGAWFVLRKDSAARSPLISRGPVDLIGDSLAMGLALPLGKTLYERLKSPQGVAFHGWGIGGTTAPQWVGKIDAVLAGQPAAILISLGTNDSVSEAGKQAFGPAIQKIVGAIRAAGVLPVLLAPPPMPFSTSEILAAMAATGAPVIAAPPGLERAPDKVHLTPKGYEDWTAAIVGAIT